jgi:hypothetical protein
MKPNLSNRFARAIITCLALCGFVWAADSAEPPSYEGKPLSYWFERLPLVFGNRTGAIFAVPGAGGKDCRVASAAIRKLGTNFIPFLIEKLAQQKKESATMTSADIAREREERSQAVAGLLALCPLPPEAAAKLRTLSLDFDRSAWYEAGFLLKANNDPRLVKDTLGAFK